ncbi:MAG: tRNA pseudouridine(38-40) synthase TruA [Candidatus Babeliaceae bacterium]|nr:tRNA pseudouridine(38-40) synthase TruA [Candidatus Babeliaceae bacterium]
MGADVHQYTLCIAYDGSAYQGWQEQADDRTIAGTIRKTFERVFQHPISLVGSSRTDAGVHALGQIARITTPLDLAPATMKRAFNNSLPNDIHIRTLERTLASFHPQHNVQEKIYWYHVFTERPLPGFARFGNWHPYRLRPELLKESLNRCVGTYDFWSFSSEPQTEKSTCTILHANLIHFPHANTYRIVIGGNRFLYHMIRRIVGMGLLIASAPDRTPDEMDYALTKRIPRERIPTAPPEGLILRRIRYNETPKTPAPSC